MIIFTSYALYLPRRISEHKDSKILYRHRYQYIYNVKLENTLLAHNGKAIAMHYPDLIKNHVSMPNATGVKVYMSTYKVSNAIFDWFHITIVHKTFASFAYTITMVRVAKDLKTDSDIIHKPARKDADLVMPVKNIFSIPPKIPTFSI